MIIVSMRIAMRIEPGDRETNVVEIERRLRECAQDESWKVEKLEVWQPADDRAIATLKAAVDSRGAAEGQVAIGEEAVSSAKCPACRRDVQIRGGRLARHHDRVLKRLCRGSGGAPPQ